MIDSTGPDLRTQGTEQLPARPARLVRRAGYLPSDQVIEELVRLGPDLSTLAEELRSRLTEPDLTSRSHEHHAAPAGIADIGALTDAKPSWM
jgi:hypothetical protein